MGKIEEAIYENYIKSLEEGDLEQANKAVKLIETFKQMVESGGFLDYSSDKSPIIRTSGLYFEPLIYELDPITRIVYARDTIIHLSHADFIIFDLFHNEQSKTNNLKVIIHKKIKETLESNGYKSSSKRVNFYRLCSKFTRAIGFNPFMKIKNEGYVFIANGVTRQEEH